MGVPSLDRGYVPTPFEERGENPTATDLSLKFLREELIPFVEKNYRTNAFRILYGHSVGGLFTMYTLFNEPDLFTAYLAGSPLVPDQQPVLADKYRENGENQEPGRKIPVHDSGQR